MIRLPCAPGGAGSISLRCLYSRRGARWQRALLARRWQRLLALTTAIGPERHKRGDLPLALCVGQRRAAAKRDRQKCEVAESEPGPR